MKATEFLFDVPEKDVRLMSDIIEGYADKTQSEIIEKFQHIFGYEISPFQYIVFGRLLGDLLRPINRGLTITNN